MQIKNKTKDIFYKSSQHKNKSSDNTMKLGRGIHHMLYRSYLEGKRINMAILPNEVDINRTHCASKNYPVSPLRIVNSQAYRESINHI